MKAAELRLGNWFNYFHPENGFSDTQIDIDYLILLDSEDFERSDYEFEPIPLTEEWLIKFGFSEKDERFEVIDYWKDTLKVSIGKSRTWFCIKNNSFSVTIKHIHQLQNLYFALTGEELVLKE